MPGRAQVVKTQEDGTEIVRMGRSTQGPGRAEASGVISGRTGKLIEVGLLARIGLRSRTGLTTIEMN